MATDRQMIMPTNLPWARNGFGTGAHAIDRDGKKITLLHGRAPVIAPETYAIGVARINSSTMKLNKIAIEPVISVEDEDIAEAAGNIRELNLGLKDSIYVQGYREGIAYVDVPTTYRDQKVVRKRLFMSDLLSKFDHCVEVFEEPKKIYQTSTQRQTPLQLPLSLFTTVENTTVEKTTSPTMAAN